MLLYNVTLILEEDAAEEWLDWMKTEHVPAVMETGKFVSNRLLRVLDSPNEGITYCAQYIAENREAYDEYQRLYAPALQAALQARFEQKFVAFRTLMEFVG